MGDTTAWSHLLDKIGIYDLDDLTGSNIGLFLSKASPELIEVAERILSEEGSYESIAEKLNMDTEDVMEAYEEVIRTFDLCIPKDNKRRLRRLLRFYRDAFNWNISINPSDYTNLDDVNDKSIRAAYYYVILCKGHDYAADILECTFREVERYFQKFNSALWSVHNKNNVALNRPIHVLMREELTAHTKQWFGDNTTKSGSLESLADNI